MILGNTESLYSVFLLSCVLSVALSSLPFPDSPAGCDSSVRCVNSLGAEETYRCSDYKSVCQGETWSRPIPLENGRKCYNGQEIDSPYCSHTATTACSFVGVKCATSLGDIINNACTN